MHVFVSGLLVVSSFPSARRPSPEQYLEPFPSPESFKAAAQAFIAKYEGRARVLGPERTNVGWQWMCVTSRWRRERGYMYRRGAIYTTLERKTESTQAELEEEEEDEAAAPPTGRLERVEVDYSVVYSPTYRVPMLCVRAWDEQGVPLTLQNLVTHVLRASLPAAEDDTVRIPGAPFPLLQATEHPVTGDMVWSVHPCEVRGAVAEVVRGEVEEGAGEAVEGEDVGAKVEAEEVEVASEVEGSPPVAVDHDQPEDDKTEEHETGNRNEIDNDNNGGNDNESDTDPADTEAETAWRVRWLEAWFMLSDSVVDLTI